MKKILYWIWYQALKLKAFIMKLPLKSIWKDYFIFNNRVVELKWLYIVDCFTYKQTVQHISWTKFIVNGNSIIDIDDGINVLHYDTKLRPNVAWYIINNKQYDWNLDLIDDGELFMVIMNLIITKTSQNDWFLYKILNLKWEELYRMFDDKNEFKTTIQWDYLVCEAWKLKKEIHWMWIKEAIELC